MSINEHPGDALIAQWEALEDTIRQTAFPALVEEEVTDDGETYMALRCTRCGTLAGAGALRAIDVAHRSSDAEEPNDDDFDHRRLTFYGDSAGDYTETIYYVHDGHAVSLPDGWTENWT